jgi:antitoxin component YwqK of YwqJK toxin-antitoxin module
MKKLLFILLITIPVIGFSQVYDESKNDLNILERYDNGQVKVEGIMNGGVPHGFINSYYENGQFDLQGKFDMGVKVGYWKWYYENGLIKMDGNYQDGKLNGLWKTYDEGGNLISEETWLEDIEISKKCFDKNGSEIECQ